MKFILKKKSIRGVEGDGMLCSEKELNLPETIDGIIELNSNYKIGNSLDKGSPQEPRTVWHVPYYP